VDIKIILDHESHLESDPGYIVAAFNLMMLGHLTELIDERMIFWIDGIGANIALRGKISGGLIKKRPGVEFLRALIPHLSAQTISILGDNPVGFQDYLHKSNVSIGKSMPLPQFDTNKMEALDFSELAETIIISLPSPKQEILAKYLNNLYKGHKRIYCFGGAIGMIDNPMLECPKLFRKLGLEWLYRLRHDTRRRLRRLMQQTGGLFKNISTIRNATITIFNNETLTSIDTIK